MEKSDQINEISLALSIAQGEMELAKKEKENPFFKASYADLASVWEACRKPLNKNALAVLQTFKEGDGKTLNIETLLAHKSGQWIKSILSMPILKQDPQAIGSLITYGRRYSLMAILGIAPEDDDAENAFDRKNKSFQTTSTDTEKKKEKTENQVNKISKWIMEMSGNNKEVAKDLFKSFTKYGDFEGYDSLSALKNIKEKNRKQFYVIYCNIKKKYKEYQISLEQSPKSKEVAAVAK